MIILFLSTTGSPPSRLFQKADQRDQQLPWLTTLLAVDETPAFVSGDWNTGKDCVGLILHCGVSDGCDASNRL